MVPKAKKRMVPVEERRGVPDQEIAGSWGTLLIRLPGDAPLSAPEALIDRLQQHGLLSAVHRGIEGELFAGTFAEPDGRWALLCGVKGQAWFYLCPSWNADPEAVRNVAARADLRALLVGHQDTASATYVQLYEGKSQSLDFQSVGFADEGDPGGTSDTLFRSEHHKRSWLKQFPDEFAAQAALVTELDAYAPFLAAAPSKGKLELISDDDELLKIGAYKRIDLLEFAPLEDPPPAGRKPSGTRPKS